MLSFCFWRLGHLRGVQLLDTGREHFLLVERLISSSVEEEWRDIVEKCDGSETFALEAFHLKARREYAIARGLTLQDVTLEEVENSPQGLQAWADMCVSVPGIEEDPNAPSPPPSAASTTPITKRKAETGAETDDTGVTTPKKRKSNPKKGG